LFFLFIKVNKTFTVLYTNKQFCSLKLLEPDSPAQTAESTFFFYFAPRLLPAHLYLNSSIQIDDTSIELNITTRLLQSSTMSVEIRVTDIFVSLHGHVKGLLPMQDTRVQARNE